MARPITKSDEGHVILTTLDNGEDHLAVLVKFNEEPGLSRIKFLNEFGDKPTQKSRWTDG